MLKRFFAFYFVIAVLCAVITTSTGCRKLLPDFSQTLLSVFRKPKPPKLDFGDFAYKPPPAPVQQNTLLQRRTQDPDDWSNIVDDIVDVAGEVFDDWARNEIRERQRERFNPPTSVLGRGFPATNTADTMNDLWYLKKHTPSAVTECDGK